MAAIGGIVMMIYDITGKKIPKFLALGHGLIALAGFLILAMLLFQLIG
jgi:hypothetical protein